LALLVLFWAVVDVEIEEAIELFPSRAQAEELMRRLLEDEPDWRRDLRIERIRLGSESPN
jgi:hypothetical protein